jgi:hypothetical protein
MRGSGRLRKDSKERGCHPPPYPEREKRDSEAENTGDQSSPDQIFSRD